MTDLEDLRRRRDAVVAEHGPWNMHRIQLAPGLDTAEDRDYDLRLRRFVQTVSDLYQGQLAGLRVLDLACGEGQYALEFARHGAQAVGIEIRESFLARCRFAQEALGLEGVEFVQDDVRNLSRERYGSFDVVICSGILYHLDTPDVFEVVARIGEVCSRVLLLDAVVALRAAEARSFEGREYWGLSYREHAEEATPEERARAVWQSIDNTHSFWLTEGSLANLLAASGFTSVSRCLVPHVTHQLDRASWVALKGAPVEVRSAPPLNAADPAGLPPRPSWRASPTQLPGYVLWDRVRPFVPEGVKQGLKRALGIGTPPVEDEA